MQSHKALDMSKGGPNRLTLSIRAELVFDAFDLWQAGLDGLTSELRTVDAGYRNVAAHLPA